MFDENEKKELLAGMVSASRRLDFETMRRNSQPPDPLHMNIDEVIDFLEAALRLSNLPSGPLASKRDYPRPLI
ncbi:MAG: hypothetical protein A2V88_00910 [Elusimicrobia bacterium RBG_16_66_12]|nr:MAG: hypothetical protein A2V88_00910 [Elusimicrobia bacterium RBG_16_66_12]